MVSKDLTSMVSKDLVQKSVRLPADLVNYIESCEGYTFTDKILGILVDYRDGLTTRGQDLKYLRKRFEDCSRELEKLEDIIARSHAVFMKAAVLMTDVSDFSDHVAKILEEDDTS